jgi:hypothetical protein
MPRTPKNCRFCHVDAPVTLGDRIIHRDRSHAPESVAKSKLLIADRAVAGRRQPRDFAPPPEGRSQQFRDSLRSRVGPAIV